jgi:hypothetical protein
MVHPTGQAIVMSLSGAALVLVTVLSPAGGAAEQVAATSAVPLSPCVSSDHGNPVFVGVSVDRDRVDVTDRTQVVAVRARWDDTGGPGVAVGVTSVSAGLGSGSISTDLRHEADGAWTGRLRIPRGTAAGNLALAVTAIDGAHNFASAGRAELAATGSPTMVTVTSAGDRRPPVLSMLRFGPRVVDVVPERATVTVAVDARDPGSGVVSVSASMQRRQSSSHRAYFSTPAQLRLVRGNREDGRWRGTVTIPGWAAGGRWDLSIEARDVTGHVRYYWRDHPRGVPAGRSSIQLRPVWVHSARDTAPPVLGDVRVSTTAVDVRTAPQPVVITLHAHDRRSGIAADPWISIGGYGAMIRMRLVAGTRYDGVWRGSWTPTPCGQDGGVYAVAAQVRDRAGHQSELVAAPAPVTVLGNDTSPPQWRARPVGDTFELDFSEDVVGITRESALVRIYDAYRATSSYAAPGSWTCLTAVAGLVDCDDGPVRTARFVPDTPLPPGFNFPGITFNPEHILSVTDMSGNPLTTIGGPTILTR